MRQLNCFQLLIDNQEIREFTSVHIVQHHDWHHQFFISIPFKALGKRFEDNLGKHLTIHFHEEIENKVIKNIFSGIVIRVEINKTSEDNTEVILIGKSPTCLLESRCQCRSFSDKTLAQIADEVLSEYPKNLLKPEIAPFNDSKLSYCVQYRETDYQFLRRLAFEYGQWLVFDGVKLYFGKVPSKEITALTLGQSLFHVNFSLKIEPVKCNLQAYDYQETQHWKHAANAKMMMDSHTLTKKALRVSGLLMNKASVVSLRQHAESKNALENLGKARLTGLMNDLVRIGGISDNPELEVGKMIQIKNAGELNGKYWIIATSHDVANGGQYENHFEAIPASIQPPPIVKDISIPVCEPQIAIVEENEDPEGLGRIKVRFFWQKSSECSPWIRIANPHAGVDHGSYWVPEIGDEVLIGFEYQHPERPVVLGSLYNGRAKLETRAKKENVLKGFITRSGNKILFNDTDGKEEILIGNKESANAISLTLEGPGKISITACDTLELAAKSISLKAEKEISLVSDQGKATIQAMNTTLKSSGKLEVNGGGMAEIKAGIIKLN